MVETTNRYSAALIRRTCKLVLILGITVTLAACKGGGGGGGGGGEAALGCTSPAVPSNGATPMSVGGLGGCIDAITVEIENAAAALRAASRYTAQQISFLLNGQTSVSNSLLAVRAEYAHALGLKGAGQLIAIRDEGFDMAHVEFSGKTIRYGIGYDAASLAAAATAGGLGAEDHGTAVAGLAAGTDEAGATLGIAPDADLLVSSWLTAESEAQAVNRAIALGAIVQNNSWGYVGPTGDPLEYNTPYNAAGLDPAYFTALRNFAGTVGVVVFASDNDATRSHSTLMAALPSQIPELEEGWLSVINVSRDYDPTKPELFDDDNYRLWSSGCFESARWCLAADGYSYVADGFTGNGYRIGDGTSYAAPRVSGAIAILAAAFPNLTPKELRNRLLITADNSFFDSAWTTISTMTFAAGLTHDYDWVYGHGFLDLRAALLPIGAVAAAARNGARMELGKPAVIAGGASGDALAKALASIDILAVDQLGGGFTVGAGALAVQDQRTLATLPQLTSDMTGLRRAQAASIVAGKTTGLDLALSPFAGFGGTRVPVDLGAGFQAILLAPTRGADAYGIELARTLEWGDAALRVGLSTLAERGAVLGIAVPGNGISLGAQTNSIGIEFSQAIGSQTSLRLGASFGTASANGAGMIDTFDGLRHSSFGIAWERTGVFSAADTLTLFARAPTAVVGGSASLSLASALVANDPASPQAYSVEFADLEIDLSPDERELDLGFEYRRGIGQNGELLLGLAHALNAGNIAGRHDTRATLGVQFSF